MWFPDTKQIFRAVRTVFLKCIFCSNESFGITVHYILQSLSFDYVDLSGMQCCQWNIRINKHNQISLRTWDFLLNYFYWRLWNNDHFKSLIFPTQKTINLLMQKFFFQHKKYWGSQERFWELFKKEVDLAALLFDRRSTDISGPIFVLSSWCVFFLTFSSFTLEIRKLHCTE